MLVDLPGPLATLLMRGAAISLQHDWGASSEWRVIVASPRDDRICWIRLRHVSTSTPEWTSWCSVRRLHAAGALTALVPDVYRRQLSGSDASKKIWQARTRIVDAVLTAGEAYWIGSKASRALLILSVSEQLGVPPLAIRRVMSSYYVHGMTLDAVAPVLERCGAPTRPKRRGDKPLGRRSYSPPPRLQP